MSDWHVLWVAWILTSLGSFLAIELTAVFTHRMDRTLSRRLRAWLGIEPIRPWRKLGGVFFATTLGGAVSLLIWHIVG